MEDKEWLTADEMSKAADYCKGTLEKRARLGKYPEGTTKLVDNNRRLYHRSLLPILKENKRKWREHQEAMNPPPDAIPYDGYYLTPDEIARLEAVRCQNGYRAIHWTTKSLQELIAMGGDKQNEYSRL